MKRFLIYLIVVFVSAGCGNAEVEYIDSFPDIFPDYIGVTVPETMVGQVRSFTLSDGAKVRTKVTRNCDTLYITVSARGKRYRAFPVYVSRDSIDPYIAYRLIEPGYESWKNISICYRDLSSYREKEIVTSRNVDEGCINCHSFQGGSPDNYMFHVRGKNGGTVFVGPDGVNKIDLSEAGPMRQGAYPAWHPDGSTIAFSANTTRQSFSVAGSQPIEVYDIASDLIFLDVASGAVREAPGKVGNGRLETFPAWSSDGRKLFWCSTDSIPDINVRRGEVHYDIRCGNWENGELSPGDSVVWQCDTASASFPRIKGKWLLFTRSSYGTFPIWHREADLVLMDLETGFAREVSELNSSDTESYHSWSSNGKWVVFSSRRLDGRYTRLYIAHFDGNGHFDKPFLLPQSNPEHNILRLKSYNVPEFVCGEPSACVGQIKKFYGK